MGKGSGLTGKRRGGTKQGKKSSEALPSLSQGAESDTDESELDFDPKALLVQLNAKKTQKTKKDTRKLQRWSNEVIRRVRCAMVLQSCCRRTPSVLVILSAYASGGAVPRQTAQSHNATRAARERQNETDCYGSSRARPRK